MKIALFFSSDPSSPGGVQEHILHLSRGLKQKGHQVMVFGPEKNIYRFPAYRAVGTVINTPLLNGNWASMQFLKVNKEHLVNELNQYDLLHIHEPYVPFAAFDLIRETTVPKIATFHTAWNDDSLANILNSLIPLFKDIFSRNIKGAIFVSQASYQNWRELLNHKVKHTVIYNGVDLREYHSHPRANKNPRLLFVGRLVPRKGIRYLLKAYLKVLQTNTNSQLTIVGEGPDKFFLKRFIRIHRLERQINYVGSVHGKAKIKSYQTADIFCAPYIDEAFGITILEALASGCCVVGFRNEAFKEIFADYPYPELLVRSRNWELLAKAILKLINDQKLRQELQEWGKQAVKEYDWDLQIEKTLQFYKKCL